MDGKTLTKIVDVLLGCLRNGFDSHHPLHIKRAEK